MKMIVMVFSIMAMISQAYARTTTTEITFTAPKYPDIDKPASAKVEVLKKVIMPAKPSTGLVETFQFTYMVTLERGCKGTLTLTSTYNSAANNHEETIKKSYRIKDGALTESR
jgi:hypothetical protein